MQKYFRYKKGKLPLPLFFPDATRAVLKTLDSVDIEQTKTPGILVNTYHLWQEIEPELLSKTKGVGNFMGFEGPVISDSGGFQIMSLIKSGKVRGKVTEEGVLYKNVSNQKVLLTPEKSIEFQFNLMTDLMVVLDDFTDPASTYDEAKESVRRTIEWAKRSKSEFELQLQKRQIPPSKAPYLIGVVQGGKYQDLRKMCAQELVKIGFNGLGYGGWPLNNKNEFDYESAKTIADNAPDDYLLYALGIGKPEDIVGCSKLGFNIYDCVLPTRDARHKRLYVFNAEDMDSIDVNKENFYSYYNPDKNLYSGDTSPVSKACDCHLCKNYSRAYLHHLFKIGDFTAGRLASIHNLRFYSLLTERIRLSK